MLARYMLKSKGRGVKLFSLTINLIHYKLYFQVAESLLNPFGDDDEDFPINYLIDRNLQVYYDTYLICQ